MTWTKSFTNPADESIRDSAEKVDLSDLKPQYQEMFHAAVAAAEGMIPNDEAIPGELTINLVGYTAPYDDGDTEIRSVSATIQRAPRYVESTPINEADLGNSHNF